MKNLNILANLSSRTQEFKLNLKWLFSFCLILLLSLPSNSLLAQPDSFTVLGCTNSNHNGNYSRNTMESLGCPCYNNNTNGGVLVRNTSGQWRYKPGSCISPTDPTITLTTIFQGTSCDISTATATSACVTLNFFPPLPSTDIPTLSEWGLLILALILMTLGTLYLLQPKSESQTEHS